MVSLGKNLSSFRGAPNREDAKKKMAATGGPPFPYAKKRYESFTEIYGTRVRVTLY